MHEPFVFHPHSLKQQQLILSDYDLTFACTGTQWGKSTAASLWLKRNVHYWWSDPSANHLLLAPSYKTMHQSMLPYFIPRMIGYGDYFSSREMMELNNSGRIYMRTGTDPNSIVGIPNVRSIWLDEGGLATLYFWENIQARAAAVGAKILVTTSPYARNWLYRNYVKKRHQLKHILFLEAASWENPYHAYYDPVKREKARQEMDERRFDMVFGGEWGQMAGLVYDCFDEQESVIEPFEIPFGSKIVAGIDWGTTDPFVLLVRAITPEGKHIQISEFYKSGLNLFDMVSIARQKKRVYGIERFYCGQDQPGYVDAFNREGLSIEPVDNDIKYGIGLHYELIKTRRFQIFKDTSPHSLDEYDTYHYPEPKDLEPDQNAKEALPVGQNDHAMDASRYITVATYRSRVFNPRDRFHPLLTGEPIQIQIPKPTNERRLKKLMQPSHKRADHTENFGE